MQVNLSHRLCRWMEITSWLTTNTCKLASQCHKRMMLKSKRRCNPVKANKMWNISRNEWSRQSSYGIKIKQAARCKTDKSPNAWKWTPMFPCSITLTSWQHAHRSQIIRVICILLFLKGGNLKPNGWRDINNGYRCDTSSWIVFWISKKHSRSKQHMHVC